SSATCSPHVHCTTCLLRKHSSLFVSLSVVSSISAFFFFISSIWQMLTTDICLSVPMMPVGSPTIEPVCGGPPKDGGGPPKDGGGEPKGSFGSLLKSGTLDAGGSV